MATRYSLVVPAAAVLLVVSSLPSQLSAQTAPLRFDHLTVEQGLSQDIVGSIAQDGEGFMWFGTEDGLNRYDGYSIKVYKHNPRDSTSISADVISGLFVDRLGVLWVIASDVCRYDPDTDGFVRVPHSAGASTMFEDHQGELLVGVADGLAAIDRKNNALVPLSGPLKGTRVYRGCRGMEGEVWLGTSRGLYRYESSTQTITPYGFHDTEIGSIIVDPHGSLWYTGHNEGIRRLNPLTGKEDGLHRDPRDPKSLGDDVVLTLYGDRQGNIWVGTFTGLERFDPGIGGFDHFRSDPHDPRSLRGDRIYTIFQDRDGALWIGTFRGGVSRMDPYNQKFAHFFHSPSSPGSLNGKEVLSVMEDSHGNLWVGTEQNGVAVYDQGMRRFSTLFSNRRKGLTVAIAEDRKGRIWIATESAGLMCYDTKSKKVRQFLHDPSSTSTIRDNSIRALYVDRGGVLWIGLTAFGLDRYNEESDSFSHWMPDSSRVHTGVWRIQEDRQGRLLLGTMNDDVGAYSFETTTFSFTPIRLRPPGFASSVRAFWEDSSGILWLGSWGSGLFRYDTATREVRQFKELDGLSNNFVKGMLADENGRLWISTENGLSRFDPKTESFRNYSVRDGLQSNFFWSGSFCKGKDGRMYFGGTNGFNVFHPDSIRDNPNVPPVVITRFQVLNQPARLARAGDAFEEVRLSHAQDFFSFEFVALNYAAPEKNRYAYQMEGFDREWTHAGARRYAAYTHLDPGSYTFRVKASNNDGVWNDAGTSVQILILPPFWETWWFRVLAILGIGSSLYTLYVYRVRRIVAMERLRARIAADLHDDVGSELGHIALASQLLARKAMLPEKEQHQLTSIGTSALHASDMMKEIVWLLNPKNDSLQDILLRMKTVAEEQLRGIEYEFNAPRVESADMVDLQVKRNVFLMYKEVVHNIVKHARATNVSIQVQLHARRLSLAVVDNGVGFDLNVVVPGNGLGNLRNRAAQIGGSLSIDSEVGKGTRVHLVVQI